MGRIVTLNYMEFIIRNVRKDDYDAAEKITRDAFYNLYVPGCVEHYLIHTMHSHLDFIPELSFISSAIHILIMTFDVPGFENLFMTVYVF